eukprot:gene1859-33274_t
MPPTHPVIQAIQDAMPPEGTEIYNFYENDVKTLEDVKSTCALGSSANQGGTLGGDGAHYTWSWGLDGATGVTRNSKVPDSLSNGIAFSDFRGARKEFPWQFKLQMNGVYVKYDSATSKLRLNTGTEMLFEIVKGDSIFDGSGEVACYALQETTTKHYLHVTTAGVVSMKPTIMNSDASYSFKMFTSDGGQTNTLYCSVAIPKVGTQQTDMEFPYKNAWLAYQSGTDTVYAAFWSTLTSTVTFWSYLTMNESPDVRLQSLCLRVYRSSR